MAKSSLTVFEYNLRDLDIEIAHDVFFYISIFPKLPKRKDCPLEQLSADYIQKSKNSI